jgi:hypothetical protein
MTGFPPIAPPPPAALDIVKPDGLIPSSKEPYLQSWAVGRIGETFSSGARSISYFPVRAGLARLGALERRIDMQKRVWIG